MLRICRKLLAQWSRISKSSGQQLLMLWVREKWRPSLLCKDVAFRQKVLNAYRFRSISRRMWWKPDPFHWGQGHTLLPCSSWWKNSKETEMNAVQVLPRREHGFLTALFFSWPEEGTQKLIQQLLQIYSSSNKKVAQKSLPPWAFHLIY